MLHFHVILAPRASLDTAGDIYGERPHVPDGPRDVARRQATGQHEAGRGLAKFNRKLDEWMERMRGGQGGEKGEQPEDPAAGGGGEQGRGGAGGRGGRRGG